MTVDLSGSQYTNSANDNQLNINTFGDDVDGSVTPTVSTTGGPVPTCSSLPPGPPTPCVQNLQVQPDGGSSCSSLNVFLDHAAPGVTYSLAAQEDQTASGCPNGMPGVNISAGSNSSPTAASCNPTTDCAVTINDPTLGNVTYTIGSGQAGGGVQTFEDTRYDLQYSPQNQGGGGGPTTPTFGDQTVQTASVGSSVNSSTASASLPGVEGWQLSVFNNLSSPLTGTQVSVDTTSSGLDLTNAAEFGFSSQNGNGSGPNPCPTPTSSSETCPSSGVSVSSNNALQVNTSPNPQTGVPVTETTGFDSSRRLAPPRAPMRR